MFPVRQASLARLFSFDDVKVYRESTAFKPNLKPFHYGKRSLNRLKAFTVKHFNKKLHGCPTIISRMF